MPQPATICSKTGLKPLGTKRHWNCRRRANHELEMRCSDCGEIFDARKEPLPICCPNCGSKNVKL